MLLPTNPDKNELKMYRTDDDSSSHRKWQNVYH